MCIIHFIVSMGLIPITVIFRMIFTYFIMLTIENHCEKITIQYITMYRMQRQISAYINLYNKYYHK